MTPRQYFTVWSRRHPLALRLSAAVAGVLCAAWVVATSVLAVLVAVSCFVVTIPITIVPIIVLAHVCVWMVVLAAFVAAAVLQVQADPTVHVVRAARCGEAAGTKMLQHLLRATTKPLRVLPVHVPPKLTLYRAAWIAVNAVTWSRQYGVLLVDDKVGSRDDLLGPDLAHHQSMRMLSEYACSICRGGISFV